MYVIEGYGTNNNGHKSNIFSVAYSTSGSYIVSCSHDNTDNTISVWDAADGR